MSPGREKPSVAVFEAGIVALFLIFNPILDVDTAVVVRFGFEFFVLSLAAASRVSFCGTLISIANLLVCMPWSLGYRIKVYDDLFLWRVDSLFDAWN